MSNSKLLSETAKKFLITLPGFIEHVENLFCKDIAKFEQDLLASKKIISSFGAEFDGYVHQFVDDVSKMLDIYKLTLTDEAEEQIISYIYSSSYAVLFSSQFRTIANYRLMLINDCKLTVTSLITKLKESANVGS